MRKSRLVTLVVATLAAWLFMATPALALVDPTPVVGAPRGPNTEMTLTGLGPGHGVSGFIAKPRQLVRPGDVRLSAVQPDERLRPKERGVRRRDHRHTVRRQCAAQPVLHRHPHRHAARLRLRARARGHRPTCRTSATSPRSSTSTTRQSPASRHSATRAIRRRQCRPRSGSSATDTSSTRSDPLHDTVAHHRRHDHRRGPAGPAAAAVVDDHADLAERTDRQRRRPVHHRHHGAGHVTSTGADMFADAGATVPIANGATVANGANIWFGLHDRRRRPAPSSRQPPRRRSRRATSTCTTATSPG